MNTAELAQAAKVTRRKIRLWAASGIVKALRRRAVRSGFRLRFDDGELFRALIVRELRSRGVALKKIRRLKLTPAKGKYLLIVRNRVEWATESEALIEHISRVHSPVMLVSIHDSRMEYAAAMERRTGEVSAAPPLRRAAA